MKRKLTLMLICLMAAITANAQFENGKKYIGASLSGLNLSYNSTEKSHLSLEAKAGLMFTDDWMIMAHVAYDKRKDMPATSSFSAGVRYYIVQNGLYLGASAGYLHCGKLYDDFQPSLQVGYAFFLNETITIEPEIYYNQSFKNHSDYSTVGFRIGLGIYL